MLTILTGSARRLNAVAKKGRPTIKRGVLAYTTKSSPINPSKFNNAGRNRSGINVIDAAQSKNTTAGMLDFGAAAMKAKASSNSAVTKDKHHTSSSVSKTHEQSPSHVIGGGQPELKPKTIRRVADTDWYFITSVSDAKYFFNRKTGETASKLPQSVADHVNRIVTAAENDAVMKNPGVSLPKSTEASANVSSQKTSSVPLDTTATIASSSILHQQATRKVQSESNLTPITPANVRVKIHQGEFSIREKEKLNIDEESEQHPPTSTAAIAFTDEQRSKRRAELQEEYRKSINSNDAILNISDEEIDAILQDEADQADTANLVEIPSYRSRIKEEVESLSQSTLDKTNRSLSEMADRMIMRGESKKLISYVTKTYAMLQDRFDKGVPLTMRERAAFLTGLFMACKAHVHLRTWGAAQKCLETAKLVNPDHPYTHLCEAYILYSQQEFIPAIKTLDLAIEQDPTHIEALSFLAETYLELEDIKSADDALEDILRLEPTNYLALLMKSRVAAAVGQLEESNEFAQRAIRADQSRPEAYLMEAKLLLQAGHIDSGISSIHQALSMDKNYGPAFALFGRLLLQQEKPNEAESAFKAALDINPNNIEALIGLSVLAFSKNEWQHMLQYSSRAASIDKGAVEAWFQKGRAELELKQWQSSIASFEYCIALDKRSEDAYIFLGNALHGAGRTADCITRMDQLLSFMPNSAKARINKGFALQSLAKFEDALRQFEEAIAIDPTDMEAKMGKVAILYAMGQNEQASSYYATFKTSDTNQAYEAAMKMASQSKVSGHNTGDGSKIAGEASFTDDSDDADIGLELAKLTDSIEKGMKISPQSAMTMSEEDLRNAMEFNPSPDQTPVQLAEELQSELARVNEILSKVGLNPVSLDSNQLSQEPQTIDTSKVNPQDLKEYMDLVKDLQEGTKNSVPNPTNEEEQQVADSLGLTPEILEQMKKLSNHYNADVDKNSVDALFSNIKKDWAATAKQLREELKRKGKSPNTKL